MISQTSNKRMRPNNDIVGDHRVSMDYHRTLPVELSPSSSWWITESLYELSNAKPVYDSVVKARYSAAFLNPAMITGNPLDLQIAAKKAISRQARKSMITKSLPMEMLYALSPRTGISDSLKELGFNPKLSSVLVVWIHSALCPPQDELAAFEQTVLANGRSIPLNELKTSRNLKAIRDFFEFSAPPDVVPFSPEWDDTLCSYVTSKIGSKE